LDPVRELPYRPVAFMLHLEAGQMAASDYVSIASKNCLRRPGRPQMSLSRTRILVHASGSDLGSTIPWRSS
jgi:hypothetical protein